MSIVPFSLKQTIDWSRFDIRPLTADDCHAYRALRQKILDIGEAKYFGISYRREKEFTAEQNWRDWCTEDSLHCIMGTFCDGQLIGIMNVIPHETKDSQAAEWDSVWIDPQFRHIGLARYSYEKLAQWTQSKGYTRVATFIRADNHRMLEIRHKRGSKRTGTKYNELWADGSICDAYCFEFDLLTNTNYETAAKHLQSLLDELVIDQTKTTTPSKAS